MKYLILLFISLSVNAQFKAEFIEVPFAGDSLTAETEEKLNKKLINLFKHKQVRPHITWRTYEGEKPSSCLATRQTREIDGKYSNNECATSEVISIERKDISDEVAAKEAEKLARKQAKEDLKTKVKDKQKKLTDDEIRAALELLLERE